MKFRLLVVSLVSTLIALPVIRAQDGEMKKGKEPTTELTDKMEKLSGAYRKLPKLVADPAQKDEALKQVAIIKDSVAAALKLQPDKTKTLPEADRAKFVADYQAKMKEFSASVDKLEAAINAGDSAGATKLLDEMKSERNDDHKQFQKKKEKKKEG
jgi:hypothetical protein